MVDIPKIEPEYFIAGDTVKWKKSLADYKASDGWALSYQFQGVAPFTVNASADGDDFAVTISAATTAEKTAGNYWWQAKVTKAGETFTVDSGKLEIKKNLVGLTGEYDGRSHVKKVLEALEQTILGKASQDQMSYSINGRSLSRMTPEELIKWENHYKKLYADEIAKERLAKGLGNKRKIMVRFTG